MASKLKLSIALQYGDEHALDDRMHTLEKKFQTGCDQLVLITQKIADLEIRLDRVERRCTSSSDADASGEKPSSNGGKMTFLWLTHSPKGMAGFNTNEVLFLKMELIY